MAQLSKPAIPAQMYKHFAVTTFVLTALMALLSSDESKERAPPSVQQSTQPTIASPGPSPTPAYGEAQFDTGGRIEAGNDHEFYQEYDSSRQRSATGSAVIGEIGASSTSRAGSENAGFTRDYLDSLTDEELEELLRQLRAGGVDDPATRQRAMAVMEAASRRRSGGV